jgi:hypothetical protein
MYYVKDQSNPDLDEWLKYNNPTVLKHGESLGQYKFTDNSKVKRDLEQEKKAKTETIKKNKAIAAQNKEREKLAKERMKKIEKEHKTKQTIHVQSELLAPFYERAKRADITRLSRLVNISSAYLRLCMTRKALSEEQLESLKSVLANFEWIEPVKKQEPKRKNKPSKKLTEAEIKRKERWNIANKARKEAVANGLTEFTAVCAYHGKTTYTVGSRGQARCIACMKEKSRKYNSKIQTPEQKAKFERQSGNRAEMVRVIELGLMEFSGMCDRHGMTKFIIFKKKWDYQNAYPFQYKCNECKNEYEIMRKERRKQLALIKFGDTIVT